MPWTRFTDDRRRSWEVNQVGLWMLVRQYLHAKAIHDNTVTRRQRRLLQPDLVNTEVNWSRVTQIKERNSPSLYSDLEQNIVADSESTLGHLVRMRTETIGYTDGFRQRLRNSSRETMANIQRSVDRWGTARDVARAVRDVSATTLVVGATFASGGTALGILATGSSLKSVSTYQETGNVASAVLDGTSTFVVGAIPIGAMGSSARGAMSIATPAGQRVAGGAMAAIRETTRQQAAVIVVGAGVDAQFELAKGLVNGQSMSQSVGAAATRFGIDVASGHILGPVLDHCALPVATRLMSDSIVNLASDGAVNLTSQSGDNAENLQRQTNNAPQRIRAIVDTAPVGDSDQQFVRDNVLRSV